MLVKSYSRRKCLQYKPHGFLFLKIFDSWGAKNKLKRCIDRRNERQRRVPMRRIPDEQFARFWDYQIGSDGTRLSETT